MYINKRGNKEYKPLWTMFKLDTEPFKKLSLIQAISSNVPNYPRIAHSDFIFIGVCQSQNYGLL